MNRQDCETRIAEAKRQADLVVAWQSVVGMTWFLFGTRRSKLGREYWPFGQYMFALFALVVYWLFW